MNTSHSKFSDGNVKLTLTGLDFIYLFTYLFIHLPFLPLKFPLCFMLLTFIAVSGKFGTFLRFIRPVMLKDTSTSRLDQTMTSRLIACVLLRHSYFLMIQGVTEIIMSLLSTFFFHFLMMDKLIICAHDMKVMLTCFCCQSKRD